MADEPGRSNSRRATVTMLAAFVAIIGVVGVVFSVLQRPSSPALVPPRETPGLVLPIVETPRPAAHGPVSGFGYSVADDPPLHRVLLFGGVDSYDQTWLWDGTRWSRAVPKTTPSGRFGAAAAYDPDTHLVLLFGGRLEPGQLVGDTWAWTGTTWRLLDLGTNGPTPGEGSLMSWDAAQREMVLVTPTSKATGGETWVWAGSHWSRDVHGDLPATSIASQMAFDPIAGRLILVTALPPPMGVGNTTWRFDGSAWHQLAATPPPATSGLALDPASGRLLLCSVPTLAAPSSLYSWSGAAWKSVPGSALRAELGTEVTDLDRHAFLMFGSRASPTQSTPEAVLVWVWSGSAWLQLDSIDAG